MAFVFKTKVFLYLKANNSKKIIFCFTYFFNPDIKLHMNNNTYSQLRNELSILYPGFTDIELNEMTENLLSFYKIAVKAVLEQDNQDLNQETT